MYKTLRKSIVFIFFLYTSLISQQVPAFIVNNTSYENIEEISEIINSIKESGIELKKLKFTELKALFYFIEDSILIIYKKKEKELPPVYYNFFKQFEAKKYFSSYSLFRKSLRETIDSEKYLGNNLIFKKYFQSSFNKFHFSVRSLKLKNEAYFAHQYFKLTYLTDLIKVDIGDFKINGSNPLVLSSPYGKSYYEYQHINHPKLNRLSSQNSIDKQNQFKGLALAFNISKVFKINTIYGTQTYYVSPYKDSFRSFNFYFPWIDKKTIERKKILKEKTTLLEFSYQINSRHTINLQSLYSSLSKNLVIQKSFYSLKRNKTLHFGLNYTFNIKNNHFTLLLATDKGHIASELHYNKRNRKNNFSISFYRYPSHFYNHHGTALFAGKRRPNNEYGFLIQNLLKVRKNLGFEFSFLKSKRIKPDFKLIEGKTRELYQVIIRKSFDKNKLSVKYRKSLSEKLELKYSKEMNSSNLYFKTFYLLNERSSFYLLKYSLFNTSLGFSYAVSSKGFPTYRYGLEREFLSQYYHENTLHSFLKYNHKLSDFVSFQFIYDISFNKQRKIHDIAVSIKSNF